MANTSIENRIHSLDALRAVMMLLGIVLHSSETYNVGSDVIWPKDPEAVHISQNYLNLIIHIFRMPVFFVIAGFFGALLFYERGSKKMIRNRFFRIVLPFILFLFLLHPVILLALNFTSDAFDTSLTGISTEITLFPQITYHLWFLYYLIFITVFAFVLARTLKGAGKTKRILKSVFEWLFVHRVSGILLYSFIIFAMLVWIWDTWVPTPLTFLPDLKVFLFYALFYFFGWILYKSKHLLELLKRNDWLLTILAFVIFTSKYIFRSYMDDVVYGALNAVVVWLFVFGITGLFIRYGSSPSKKWRYISDSSYWVYLVHLPLTLFIPGLIAGLPIIAFGKFIVVMISTTIICFATYHYMVRGTFIGKFLNGRAYPRSKIN